MIPRERVLAALKREPVDRIPYCEHLFDANVAAAMIGGVDKLTNDPEIIAKLQSDDQRTRTRAGFMIEPAISRAVGRDNITFWNSLYPFPGPRMYLLDPNQADRGDNADGLIQTRADLDKLILRPLDDEFWSRARAFVANKGEFAAGAMLFLGIDPTWNSMGFQNFCLALGEDREFIDEVLGRITDWLAQVAEGLCALDFDFIWAADDIAFKTATIFSPKMYREILLPHTRKVAEKINKPWIYHSDGNLMPILDDLLSQGMNAIHPLEPGAMDPVVLKKRYGNRIAFVGNISVDTLAQGTLDQVRALTRERIAQMGPGFGYLLSSSNSIAHYCRPENVTAMLDTLREFGTYS